MVPNKNNFNPIIHSRLVHKDYDGSITGPEKRKLQKEAKKELIDEFKKAFNIDGKTKLRTLECSNGDVWYYSTTHARGTTMIFFARWPVGLDCQANVDVPKDFANCLCSNYFNESEKEWILKEPDPIRFLEIWTAKEAFYKCYYAEYDTYPKNYEWNLIERDGNIAYTNGKDIYQCQKGIGGDKYTFTVCDKE